MQNYQTYYETIAKPFFAPEPWVFGLAWGIIYPLIAIAAVLTLYAWYKRELSLTILGVFALNMIGNIAFTPLQLMYPGMLWATADILLVLTTLGYLEYKLWFKQKLIFLLLLPYLLWGSFATVLQITIYFMNS